MMIGELREARRSGCWRGGEARLAVTAASQGWRPGCRRLGVACTFLLIGIGLLSTCAGALSAQAIEGKEASVRREFTQAVAEGTQALQAGENQEAEKAYRQALALDPRSVEVLNNLAIAVARQGREAEAIELYERALKLRKDDPITERNLGIAYFRAQRYAEALPLLESFAKRTPTFQSLDLTGLDLFALDRYHEAAVYLERASQADPKDLPTLDILGEGLLEREKFHRRHGDFQPDYGG